jgi:regulator of replication initiation timing
MGLDTERELAMLKEELSKVVTERDQLRAEVEKLKKE